MFCLHDSENSHSRGKFQLCPFLVFYFYVKLRVWCREYQSPPPPPGPSYSRCPTLSFLLWNAAGYATGWQSSTSQALEG